MLVRGKGSSHWRTFIFSLKRAFILYCVALTLLGLFRTWHSSRQADLANSSCVTQQRGKVKACAGLSNVKLVYYPAQGLHLPFTQGSCLVAVRSRILSAYSLCMGKCGAWGVKVISYFWLLDLCSNDSLPFSSLVLSISDKMLKTEEERKRNFTSNLKRQKGPRKQF